MRTGQRTLAVGGVAVDIPLLAWMPLVPQPDSPVQPDVLMRHTVADAQSGIDADVETVLRLIRDGRR
jgi:hypothetical protein